MEQATIGRSLVIKGDISGAESLFVDGRIEGTVNIPEHRVTVGRNGVVTADVNAREVVIMGKVRGNIICSDRLDIRSEGTVTGDVVVQRISVEDGAILKGSDAGAGGRRAEEQAESTVPASATQNRTATPPKRQPRRPEHGSQPEEFVRRKEGHERSCPSLLFRSGGVPPAVARASCLAVTRSDEARQLLLLRPVLGQAQRNSCSSAARWARDRLRTRVPGERPQCAHRASTQNHAMAAVGVLFHIRRVNRSVETRPARAGIKFRF